MICEFRSYDNVLLGTSTIKADESHTDFYNRCYAALERIESVLICDVRVVFIKQVAASA